MSDPAITNSGKTTIDGGAEFLSCAPHDYAQRRAEISPSLRTAAADSDAEICVTFPALARLGALEVALASFHDPEFAELGAAFRHPPYSVERPRRRSITVR